MDFPISGRPLHTRSLTLVVSALRERTWHARGDVIDLRKCGLVPMHADLQPAGIIHQMSIDLELDPLTLTIGRVDVEQPVVAIEPSRVSRGECCRDPAPRLRALAGERLDGGFAKTLSGAFGGPRGCSHLLTLFQVMASALRRAAGLEAALLAESGAEREPGERLFRRSVFIDGFEAPDRSTELAVQLADILNLPVSRVGEPLERLAGEWNVRAFARVEPHTLVLRDLGLAERSRDASDLGRARWRDRTRRIADLEGVPVVPGLAGRLFALLRDDAKAELLLDALLQLAPGHIQVIAATMDRWLGAGRPEGTRRPESSGSEAITPREKEPDVMRIGGMPDSCYMWRSGGPLASHLWAEGESTASEPPD